MRYLILCLGNGMNGLNSLYLSLVGFLSVAELGIGSAITFSMYRPIVEGDLPKVGALYHLFRRCYYVVGAAVFVVGCALIPALPYIAKEYSDLDVNLTLTFLLMLISVVLSFLFSAKTSLINAYKNNYITTTIYSGGLILQAILQILALSLTRSFVLYLLSRIVSVVLQWLVTSLVVRKKHRDVLEAPVEPIDAETKGEVKRNIKALFMHRLGGALVNSSDSVIISAFIGLTILGKYSNYATIMNAMIVTLKLLFTPLTSIIGHSFVREPGEACRYFRIMYGINYIVGVVFFLGYYAVIDQFITLFFGSGRTVSDAVVLTVTINGFVFFMRQATLLFRDASGTFYNDRWKPLFEGLLNVVLSVGAVLLLSHFFGEEMGLAGVIAATVFTSLTICHIVEPYVLYRHALHASPKFFYLKNYCLIALFIGVLFAFDRCMQDMENLLVSLLANGALSLLFSLVPIVIYLLFDKQTSRYLKNAAGLLWRRLLRRKDNKAENLKQI